MCIVGISSNWNFKNIQSLESEDVINSLRSIKKLGVYYKKYKDYYEIRGTGLNSYVTNKKVKIYAGNSGTLARLILGLLVNSKNTVTLTVIKFI